MNMPQGIPNCPPGLEYLTMIDQLLVHQKVEVMEGNTYYNFVVMHMCLFACIYFLLNLFIF